MLAEILANPVAWPLWAVLAFAVTMYPLGLLMPGCVCCGAGNCTECGFLQSPYQSNQTAYGRMCCNGVIAATVTLRVTNIGAAVSNDVVRGSGSPYQKTTTMFPCTHIEGDYVVPLSRSVFNNTGFCDWSLDTYPTCETQLKIKLEPLTFDPRINGSNVLFPSYFLSLTMFRRTMPGSILSQVCTGFPGPESCSIGTTFSNNNWFVRPLTSAPTVPTISLQQQQCAPTGIILDPLQRLIFNSRCDSGSTFVIGDTGCQWQMELV